MCVKLFRAAKNTALIFRSARATTVAGAWTYYFLTSIVPLAFLAVTAFNMFNAELPVSFSAVLPTEFSSAVDLILQTARRVSKGMTVFFGLTVCFSVSALLHQMKKDGAHIFGVENNKRGIAIRLSAVLSIFVLFSVFLAAAFLFSFNKSVFPSAFFTGKYKIIVVSVAFTLIFLLGLIIFSLLLMFIAPVKLSVGEALLGALSTIFTVFFGTMGFVLYVKIFKNVNAFYGTLSAVIMFLIWAYIVAFGVFTGTAVTAKLFIARKNDLNINTA